MKINTDWFLELIRCSPYGSQRALARKLRNRQGKPMDHSTLSRMLTGERAMQLEDARQIADLLGVSLGEVLAHAGLRKDGPQVRRIQITGTVGAAGEVRLEEASRTVEAPSDLPAGSIVLRGRGPFDGWLFYAGKPVPVGAKFYGRLCIAETKQGRRLLAYVLQGSRPLVNLEVFRSTETITQVRVKWIAPVLWIRSKR